MQSYKWDSHQLKKDSKNNRLQKIELCFDICYKQSLTFKNLKDKEKPTWQLPVSV